MDVANPYRQTSHRQNRYLANLSSPIQTDSSRFGTWRPEVQILSPRPRAPCFGGGLVIFRKSGDGDSPTASLNEIWYRPLESDVSRRRRMVGRRDESTRGTTFRRRRQTPTTIATETESEFDRRRDPN